MILDQLFIRFLNYMKMLLRKSIFRNKYVIIFSILTFCYLTLYNYTDYSHCSINRNIFTGRIDIDTIPGHNLTFPWVQVVQVDLKPCRIPILSNSRTFNYKLVRFNPKFYKEFVDTEGYRYYWLSNRISFNFGHDYESRGFFDVLKGYAYDSKKWDFVIIEKTQ